MRLDALHLEAFGPFTDASLDLTADGPALHVVYGPNETGKSTTLRALSGLFYGIPTRTLDAHRHPMQKLRIGARLVVTGGERLDVVRKKGNKNTLLDPSGAPIDESQLARLLSGVGREQFELMFGLDHVTLRRGAAALLESGGDLGESLYGASLGAGIHDAIARLEAEARELFAARGQKPALNAALAEFKEAQRVLRSNIKPPDGYQTQLAALEEARTAQARIAERLGTLRTEHETLKRGIRVIPGLANHRLLLAERKGLGEVPRINAEAIEKRRRADKNASDARVQLDVVGADLERLRAKYAALPPADAAADVAEDEYEALRDRLAEHNKAEADLPSRHAELESAEREATKLLADLGRETTIEEARTLLPSAKERAAIHTLANRYGEIATRAAGAQEALEAARRELDSLRAAVDAEDTDRDLSELEAAAARGRKLGDAESELAGRKAELDARREEVERLAAALPGFDGDADTAARLEVPEPAMVERRAEERLVHFEAVRTCERSAAETAEALARVRAELEADQMAGEVPSEAQLGDERRQRDRLWAVIRREMSGEEKGGGALGLDAADPDAFEAAVSQTDETADRLRREAARVAGRARLVAELAELERRAEAHGTRLAEAESELADHDAGTRTTWAELGVRIEDARAAGPWLIRHGAVLRGVRRVEEHAREMREFEARVEAATASLRSALSSLDLAQRDEASVSALLLSAQRVIESARERRAERRARDARLEQLTVDIEQLTRTADARDADLAEWKSQWSDRLGTLGAGPSTMPEEAVALLRTLEEFDKRLASADEARDRIRKMERDAARFGAELERITEAYALKLSEGTHRERGRALLRRIRDARDVARARRELDEGIVEREEQKADLERAIARAVGELDALCEAAGATDLDALIAAEERAAAASALDQRISETRAALLDAGEGRTLEELAAETEGLDKGQAAGRASDIEREIEQQVEDHNDAIRLVRNRELGLEDYETRTSASDAASDAASALAKVRETAHRYVRLRLAVTILRAEIARYRDENQAPLLAHATALFPRLTLGRYRGLQVGHDEGDAPVLRCVREDGEDVGIDALSDGTKDQLYLALRLASLVHYAEHNRPLPLILDDCLVHFDDDRARAALAVLGEVSKHFQILFFTHHERLVELAREAVAKDRLHVSNLAEIRTAAESVAHA